MAAAYSAEWFTAKAAELGWDVHEDVSVNAHYLRLNAEGYPELRLIWWKGFEGKWQFLTGSLKTGVPMRSKTALTYMQDPDGFLAAEAERVAQRHAEVHKPVFESAPFAGRVECCNKPYFFTAGQRMGLCAKPKCQRQLLASEVK